MPPNAVDYDEKVWVGYNDATNGVSVWEFERKWDSTEGLTVVWGKDVWWRHAKRENLFLENFSSFTTTLRQFYEYWEFFFGGKFWVLMSSMIVYGLFSKRFLKKLM
jgi:hypothetical protein